MRTPPRAVVKRGGGIDGDDVTGRRRSEGDEMHEIALKGRKRMVMTHEDEERGIGESESTVDMIRAAIEGMGPGEADAVADLLPSMVPVAATEWTTAYSGWSSAATTDDLVKTAFVLAWKVAAAQRALREATGHK